MSKAINLPAQAFPLWGHPYHGLIRNDRLILPAGVTILTQPDTTLRLLDGQQCFYWPERDVHYLERNAHQNENIVYQRFLGQEHPTRNTAEQAQDAARGHQWRGDFIIYGNMLYNHNLRADVPVAADDCWIYRDGFGIRWLLRYFADGSTNNMLFTRSRFGELGATPIAYSSVALTVPAAALTMPAPTPPNTAFTPAPTFSTPIRLEDVHPEGKEAIFSIPINTSAIAPPWVHTGPRTAGSFIKISVSDGGSAGTPPNMAVSVHSSPAATLGTVTDSTYTLSGTPTGAVGNASGSFVVYWVGSEQFDWTRTIENKLISVNYLDDGTLVETRGDYTVVTTETKTLTGFSSGSAPSGAPVGAVGYSMSWTEHRNTTVTTTLHKPGLDPVIITSEVDMTGGGSMTVWYFDGSVFRDSVSVSSTAVATHDGVELDNSFNSQSSSATYGDPDIEAAPLGQPATFFSPAVVGEGPAFKTFDQFLEVGKVFGIGYEINSAAGGRRYFQSILRPGNKLLPLVLSQANTDGSSASYRYSRVLNPEGIALVNTTAGEKRNGWAWDPLTGNGTYADTDTVIYC